MPTRRLSILALAALALWPSLASAQVINRPPRAFRGLFGGGRPSDPQRDHTVVTFVANATGGYDDNASTGEGLVPLPGTLSSAEAGYTGVLDFNLSYFRGRTARAFTLDAEGSWSTSRQNTFSSNRSVGLNVAWNTELGRRTTFSAGAGVDYVTQFGIAAPLESEAPPEFEPSSPSLYSVGDRPSLNLAAHLNLAHQAGRRDRFTGQYDYTTMEFQEGDGDNSRGQSASIDYARQLTRWTSLTATYDYGNTLHDFGGNDTGRPGDTHRISGGFSYLRRLSARRTMSVSASGGAQRLSAITGTEVTTAYEVWTPWAEGATSLDLAGSWTLTGSFRRDTGFFPGLTNETFVNNTGLVSLGGLLSTRFDLTVSGGFAGGRVPSVTNLTSEFTTATGSAQLRFAMTRTLALVGGYNHYWYHFTETDLPEGFPPQFSRKTVRIGLSLWLPLYGTASR